MNLPICVLLQNRLHQLDAADALRCADRVQHIDDSARDHSAQLHLLVTHPLTPKKCPIWTNPARAERRRETEGGRTETGRPPPPRRQKCRRSRTLLRRSWRYSCSGLLGGATKVCPLCGKVWAKLFASHGASGCYLDVGTALSRQLPLPISPKADRLRSHTKSRRDSRWPTAEFNCLVDCVHAQILHV